MSKPCSIPIAVAVALALSACGEGDKSNRNSKVGPPAETRPPNADFLKPAQPDQTRAPTLTSGIPFKVETITDQLEMPWSLEFLPGGGLLVTERLGKLRLVTATGKVSLPGAGLPGVDTEGQGGLLDVALDPDFESNRIIYWTYAERRPGGTGTAVARGRLALGDRPDVSDVRVIFRQLPTFEDDGHYGSRIAFAPDKTMFVTLGERFKPEARVRARDPQTHFGKVVRVDRNGAAPKDNPLVGKTNARPEIWTIGHRNPQAIAFRPEDKQMWIVEHGPQGGDELNRLVPGGDYGWPTITYGEEYSGERIGAGISAAEGLIQPNYYWDPVIAPSSLMFYDGAMFPEWRGSAFIGGLASTKLVRLTMKGDRVAGEEWLLADLGSRIRDVKQGPGGSIYIATDEGKIMRIVRSK